MAALEESRREQEVALLKAKVESVSPKHQQSQIVADEGNQSSSSLQAAFLAAPVPPFPEQELPLASFCEDKGVQTSLSYFDRKDFDTQTPDWRRPYVLGAPILQAYPHYINGEPPDDVPSPNPLQSANRHRAASLSPSNCRRSRPGTSHGSLVTGN